MQSRLMTAQLAAYYAVDLLDRGLRCDTELINAKLVSAEAAVDSARDAMDIHAAAGLLASSPAQRYLRDAYHILSPAGTSAGVALTTCQRRSSPRQPAAVPRCIVSPMVTISSMSRQSSPVAASLRSRSGVMLPLLPVSGLCHLTAWPSGADQACR